MDASEILNCIEDRTHAAGELRRRTPEVRQTTSD